jgi:hypothetical protein
MPTFLNHSQRETTTASPKIRQVGSVSVALPDLLCEMVSASNRSRFANVIIRTKESVCDAIEVTIAIGWVHV